jgi:uncharacterized protein YpmS
MDEKKLNMIRRILLIMTAINTLIFAAFIIFAIVIASYKNPACEEKTLVMSNVQFYILLLLFN